jgi:YfiH family protein
VTTDEVPVLADPPCWEVPGWRERFGLVAGISGRGDPATPFDLGLWTDRPVGEVMTRWRRLRAALPGFPAQVMAHQVHGDRVRWHDNAAGWVIHDGLDGHATDRDGLLLLVTVADCVPVYLAAPGPGAFALLHAGWRGTAAGILGAGVRLLAERTGVLPRDLVMHAGVAISGPRYEVGSEVLAGLGREREGLGPWHLDLREVLVAQARALGLTEVTCSGHCTADPDRAFFSHRGSGGIDGRMVAWLGRPGSR